MTRVLHLVSGLCAGGKERVALELCRAARAQGHDDRIAVFEHAPTDPGSELDPGGVPVDDTLAGRSSAGRVRALVKLLRAEPPRVLHAHNDTGLFLSSLAGRLAPSPRPLRVATLHNMPVAPAPFDRLTVRALAGLQDHVVCVSAELREARRAARWISDAAVIENGVDTTAFSPDGAAEDFRSSLGLDPGGLVVGMVARLDVGKRHDLLFEAARTLNREGSSIGLVLVGAGPRRSDYQDELRDSIPHLFVPHAADVPRLLRGLDVVALASDHEGLPMSLLEAMACGRPVVASRVGGVPELLGNCGSTAPPDTPLTDALRPLLDADRRATEAARCLARARAQFPLNRTLSRYTALYDAW